MNINEKLNEFLSFKKSMFESEIQQITYLKENLSSLDIKLFKEMVYSELEEVIEFKDDTLTFLGMEFINNLFSFYYLNSSNHMLVMSSVEGYEKDEENENNDKISIVKYKLYLQEIDKKK